MLTFQEMITALSNYWASKGCALHQGYDLEVGAGTFNPVTFLRCLGPEPYNAVYVEPSRRPQDGRYGQNPNRVQFYHQMQVIFKPSPYDIQELYLGSLEAVGLDLSKHDIRFVHDDWENPTIGASGLGWEVWIDGMEATQFTYFQSVGGLSVKPVTAEITYGLERLAMYLQGVDSIFDLKWKGDLLYGDIYQNSEWQWSFYNFEESDAKMWQRHFDDYEREAKKLIHKHLPIPAYDFVMKASHAFNMLDARGVISVSERARIMGRIRELAHDLAKIYVQSREKAAYPLLKEKSAAKSKVQKAPSTTFKEGETKDFLLEVGSEELPASVVALASNRLLEGVKNFFDNYKLTYKEIIPYATPRRLALHVKDLACGIMPEKLEKKGPKLAIAFDGNGTLTKAGEGFFRSLGLDAVTLDEIKTNDAFAIKNIGGHDYLFATITTKKLSTATLLAENLEKLILSVDFPKKMRWADLTIEYARPIRWLVALLGSEVIPFSIANIESGQISFGHRLKANKAIKLKKPEEYEKSLEKGFVMASLPKRKEKITKQIAAVEKKLAATALAKEQLLDQVANLVEWPEIVVGTFDQSYLQAPKEVLVSEMVEHQKYFPLENSNQELLFNFLAISNNGSSELIAKGHQKAVSSRLADGLFLFEEDLKKPLSHFTEKLEEITFHNELGSMAEKQKRVGEIALLLNEKAPLCAKELIVKAASLCKADLATQLVGEFPNLQGLIGARYARHQNEEKEVALAIEEHWMPKQEKGALPTSALGNLLSMADKIDNLLSCFALGLKPTSSSDPFGLRRQAFGLLKIIIEEKLPLELPALLRESFAIFLQNPAITDNRFAQEKEQTLSEILHFIEGRLTSLFVQKGFLKEHTHAVLQDPSPYKCYLKLEALEEFAKKTEFAALLEIYRRARKIVQGAKQEVDPALFSEPQEKALFAELQKELPPSYEGAFSQLAALQPIVTAFFDNVIVMAEDKRLSQNRIALLQKLLARFDALLDFSKIQS